MTRRYPHIEFTESGKLIARLTGGLANTKGWTMSKTMSFISQQTGRSSDMIYRWQQGRLLPKPEIMEVLVQIGHREAEMPREWGEELLTVAHYPDPINLVNKLWGPKEVRIIACRLARREHTRLVGRQDEAKKLLEFLSPRKAAYLITIDGIGGVGKTALALDVAYQCWHASTGYLVGPHIPTFEAIIFVSAKQKYLTAHGILQSHQVHRTLRKIFQEVTSALKRDDIRSMPIQEQPDLVREALGRQQTLLIVDNLETMEDKQEIISFLYELPPTVKVVITTRERAMFSPIRLEQLSEKATRELIEHQIEEKQVILTKKEITMLYQSIGGIPAALVYAIGQRAAGYSLEMVLEKVPRAEGDVARFCFQGSVEPLRGEKTHTVLMVFALFPRMPSRSAITYVAGLETDPIAVEEALYHLQLISFIREFGDRFRMLPLTREYALAELKANPDFEQQARERWIEWYLKLAKEYGGHDWEEWHVRYDPIDEEWENLLALFDWCANHERYEVLKAFWCADEPSSVMDFTTLYGYWDDRLTWLEWLRKTAEGRGDWLTRLDVIASYAYTLTLMGRYQEAEELLKSGQRQWSDTTPEVKAHLLINNGYLFILLSRFAEAQHLLDQAMECAQQVPDLRLRTRFILTIEYDRAAALYWNGEITKAQEIFSSVMEQATDFRWLWLANYARKYLADIAIEKGMYHEAEHLLEAGLAMALRNREQRRTAGYQAGFATLYQKQGKIDEALKWAKKAKEGFEQIGSQNDIQKMDKLIQDIEIQKNKPIL
jgi:tetratricopeptide (TPR) repeat protein